MAFVFLVRALAVQLVLAFFVCTSAVTAESKSKCSGYALRQHRTNAFQLEAELELIGRGCEIYGSDLPRLALSVTYETGTVCRLARAMFDIWQG